MSSSEDEAVKKLADLIKVATPSITKTANGLSITQNGQSYEIPFSAEGKTVSKTSLIKK